MGDATTIAVDYLKYLVALCITITEPAQGDLGGFDLSRQVTPRDTTALTRLDAVTLNLGAVDPHLAPELYPRNKPQDLGEMITRNGTHKRVIPTAPRIFDAVSEFPVAGCRTGRPTGQDTPPSYKTSSN